MDGAAADALLEALRNEITEHHIYGRLARAIRDAHNADVLRRIAADERRHYEFWKQHTGRDVPRRRLKAWWHYLVARIFGLTFGIKLMERGEQRAGKTYRRIAEAVPGAEAVARDEEQHEKEAIALLDEERLKYVGAVVRGLNDALVELTGALVRKALPFEL